MAGGISDTFSLEAFFNNFVAENDGLTKVLLVKNAKSPLEGYQIADKDDDLTPNYYGFIDKNGNWYIMREVISAGADTYRFIAGSSDYTTNWTNRAGLSYDYFYSIF